MVLNMNIKLSDKQKQILEWCKLGNGIQYVVVATGRQVGKTTIATLVALEWALQNVDYDIGFFMPTYKQCKKVFKDYMKMCKELNFVKFNKSDLIVTFKNGSTIQFFTCENENIRTFTFDAVVVDEACFIKDYIWTAIIEPTIGASFSKLDEHGNPGNRGKALITSTPKAKNWFHTFVTDDTIDRKVVTRFTTIEGGVLSYDYVMGIKKRIDKQLYACEYDGEFIESGTGMFAYKGLINKVAPSMKGHVAGIDVGSRDDYTVLTIQDKLGNVIFQDRWTKMSYEKIIIPIIKILKRYGSPQCHIEWSRRNA